MPAAAGQSVMALANGFAQGEAMKAQGAYQKAQAFQNADFADDQSDQAMKAGSRQQNEIRKGATDLIGQQRTAIASQGVDVNYGSAADVQTEAKASGEVDAATAKINAIREAWGFKSQAAQYRATGEMQERAAKQNARYTVLTGGMQVLNYADEGGQKAAKAAAGGA